LSTQTTTLREHILDDQTREFLDLVAADPLAPMQIGIVAPGGHGKTATLRELEQLYLQGGAQIINLRRAMTEPIGGDEVLLVDDAHQLGDAQLQDLRLLAQTQRVRLAIGYRPWPRSVALAELTTMLNRRRPPLTLSPLGQPQIAELAAAFGVAARPALIEFLHTQTGGVPRFVAWALGALAESGDRIRQGAPLEVPESAIAMFRHDLDRLDPDVQLFLLAAEAGAGLDIDLLGSLLQREPEAVAEVVEAARATGLLGHNGALVPMARRAVTALYPADRRVGVRRRLAERQLERGGSVISLARSLLGTGIGGPSVAATFETAAEQALAEEPALSAQLFAAGVAAGRPVTAVAARWAQAAALSGDLDSALRLADHLIAAPGRSDQAGGALVAATALAHRGQLARSTELYRWAGTGPARAFAAIGLIGTGQLADVPQLLETSPDDGPPTLLAGAASLMAHGVYESVTATSTSALSRLVRAADLLEPAGQAALLPDSPAALAAQVALHCGELGVAESVLERALAAHVGGTLMSARHHLLRGWILMVRGDTGSAKACLAAAKGARSLESRDWLLAVALEIGIARRNSDLPMLRRTWQDAYEAVIRQPVDLFTLLPLGELAIAAARLREQGRLAAQLEEAGSLLGQLDTPPLWATLLTWSSLHAAIISEQHSVAEQHAATLAAGARHGRYFSMVSIAAECWLEVLRGKVDPVRVEEAARGLHAAGLCWDAARLAGQAAIRTSDRKAMVSLMDCARLLQGRPTSPRGNAAPADPETDTAAAPAAATAEAGLLSVREREVARLVLDGLTYKQVGDRLFISPKTVEHHVARMRQRLGCGSRGDLLTKLRELVGDWADE
jgi:DNA-binding CsgD family transcriptional regulator